MKRPNCSHLDPEIQTLIDKYCQGNGIDVGCGYSKIGACVGIDKISWGERINLEDKTMKISQADWSFDVGDLPIKDGTMDFVYGSHILEHITLNITTDKTYLVLLEWLRVLRSSGFMLLVIPDINYCIPPIARRKKIRLFHGLQPDDVKALVSKLPVKLISFNTLSNQDIFECVLQKV